MSATGVPCGGTGKWGEAAPRTVTRPVARGAFCSVAQGQGEGLPERGTVAGARRPALFRLSKMTGSAHLFNHTF